MRARDLRLLPVAAASWAGALLCVMLPHLVWPIAGATTTATVVLAVSARAGGRRGSSAVALLAVALACAAAPSLSVAFALPARDRAADGDGRVVQLAADVTSSASIGRDGRLWVEAATVELGVPGAAAPLAVPVRLGVPPGPGYELGARVRVVGEAARTGPGERGVLVVAAASAEVVSPARGLFGVAAGLRAAFRQRASRFPTPGGELLPGLAVGDTRGVTAELDAAMTASGLSHLTAVSGANCAIVVGAVFGLTAWCGGGRRLRIGMAATALAGFVVLVTPEPSVVRAAVMAGAGMLSLLLGRPSAGAGILAVSAVGILTADPWLATSPGFALSVAASAALILLAPPLARGLARLLPSVLATALAVPLAAQLACGPIIALFSEQQSLVGVAANLLAAPAAPIATVVGLLACLCAPVPPLADLMTATAWPPASWIAATATTSADLPLAQLALPAGVPSALLVLVVSASIAMLLMVRGSPPGARTAGEGGARRGILRGVTRRLPGLMRGAAAGVLLVVFTLLGSRTLLEGPLAEATTPAEWSVAACDVGQGDALLVRSERHVALIDTGPTPAALDRCLRSLGVDRVDLLVLTHFDVDHSGGSSVVRGRVGTVLHGPVAEARDRAVLEGLAASGARTTEVAVGTTGRLGGASWSVLWPPADSAAFTGGNDAGVVLAVEGGGVPRSLFLGDLSAVPQRLLLDSLRVPTFDVVKVAHHGSADQDPALYERVRARVGLISVGAGNDYGHPRDETLDLLARVGTRVLRTDRSGRILLGLRDGALEVWAERPG